MQLPACMYNSGAFALDITTGSLLCSRAVVDSARSSAQTHDHLLPCAGVPDVVLTREAGKNAALESILRSRGVNSFELPLVETAPGPDRCAIALCILRLDYILHVLSATSGLSQCSCCLSHFRSCSAHQLACWALLEETVLACWNAGGHGGLNSGCLCGCLNVPVGSFASSLAIRHKHS